MENTSLILTILMMTPSALMLAVFKGRSRLVMGFILTGIFTALFSGEINGCIMHAFRLSTGFLSVNIAPVVEEILKACPIVFLAFLIKPDKQLLLECSIGVGVGFALLENVLLFSQMPEVSLSWAFIRGISSGLMHSITTVAVGLSMSYTISKHKIFFSGSVAALSVAIIYHSIYNIIVTSNYSFLGVILPAMTYIPILFAVKKFKKKSSPEKNNQII